MTDVLLNITSSKNFIERKTVNASKTNCVENKKSAKAQCKETQFFIFIFYTDINSWYVLKFPLR